MQLIVARSLLALLFLFVSLQLPARQQPGKDTILQRYGILTDSGTTQPARHKSVFYLVKFRAYPGKNALQPYGLVKALTRHHYILQQAVTDTALLRKVAYTYAANSNWKSTPVLLRQLEQLRDADSITVQASLDTGLALPAWCRIYRQVSRSIAIMRVKKSDWADFIAQPALRFADALRRPGTETAISNNDLTLNRITAVHRQYPQLQGRNMVVSLKENLFDTTDADIQGRYMASGIAATSVDAHATIMATLVAGAANSAPEGQGAAMQAFLSSSDFNSTSTDNKLLPDDAAAYQALGIRLQNHSYGTGIENYYGTESIAYDEQTATMDTLLHVFSSGNDGDQAPGNGIYSGMPGFANLSGTYKQAKNVLVAGATDGSNHVPATSSKGPAYDGRVKPELVAYGLDGTSNAAALTSGIATLVQDAYIQQYGRAPSTALLRTLLINSADDTGTPQVDYSSGFGAVNALRAVQTVQEERFRSGAVTTGSSQLFSLTVPAGVQQLKVSIGWNDPPAAADAPKALVNDLDLWVTDAAGNRYDPWILSAYPDADSLLAPAHRGRDTLNNTEQVTVDHPSGEIRIHVSGSNVPRGPQAYYIVYEYIPARYFNWDHPGPGSLLAAGSTVPLRWATSLDGNGNISYSLDSGVTWQSIVQDQPLADGSYNWAVPAVFSRAWLRMQTTDTAYISPSFFIAPTPEPRVGFDCTDSLLLYWTGLPGAGSYEVYALGEQYLERYTLTRDTFVVIHKQDLNATWLAVGAVHADGWTGQKSYSLDYRNQGLSCYVASLLADPVDDAQVRLTLSLGSLYNLQTIWWEKLAPTGFTVLQSSPVDGNLSYTIPDNAPHAGTNYYRVRLETADGRMLYSDTVSVAMIGAGNTFLLYPNPAGNTLQLLSSAPQIRQVQISDISGRLLKTYVVSNMQESIDVAPLTPGVYIVAVYEEGKRVFVRKIVKL
ncbi:S8 family peptidase [Chitinophaga japonensis]|nr:S8 family peptidase [Chitinophaga japonensis]